MESDEGKLFVGGLAWDTTEYKLKEHFEKYGQVKEVMIMKDRLTQRPRGFGFVVFHDPSNLDRAIRDKHSIDGRTVEAKLALSREEQRSSQTPVRSIGGGGAGNYRTKKIFVGGLPSGVTEQEFRQYFETYGDITDVVIMYDSNTKRPRGFGFITYDSEVAVEKVLHKSFHDLNNKLVEVKPALPKEASPGPAASQQPVGKYGPNSYPPPTFDGQSFGANSPFASYSNYGVAPYAYPMANNNFGYGGYGTTYGGFGGGYGGYGGYGVGYVSGPSTSYLGGPSGPPMINHPWSHHQYPPPGYIGGLMVPAMYGNYVGPEGYMSSRPENGPKGNVVTSIRPSGQNGNAAALRSDSVQ